MTSKSDELFIGIVKCHAEALWEEVLQQSVQGHAELEHLLRSKIKRYQSMTDSAQLSSLLPEDTQAGHSKSTIYKLSPELFIHIERICDEYEDHLKQGVLPDLVRTLHAISPEGRPFLLREIINLDQTYQLVNQLDRHAGYYKALFPEYLTTVDSIFQHILGQTQIYQDSASGGGLNKASSRTDNQTTDLLPAPSLSSKSKSWQQYGLTGDQRFIEKYEVLGEIGRGAMGVVLRGRHKVLNRNVAIKVMQPHAVSDRFIREAQLLAKINSPHVVTLYDYYVLESGCQVLVMEWVEGSTLYEVIKSKASSLTELTILPWMKQTCEGMYAAASLGIVHRDLKPSNILIDSNGLVRIADFGLARESMNQDELSQTGLVMGTPYYMSPEQAEDPRGVDTRSDIYSYGATYYHALVGKPPFTGGSSFSILYKHKTEPLISPRSLTADLSESTNEILERCLAKSPQDRFSSFREILKHLGGGLDSTPPWIASNDHEMIPYLERYQQRRLSYFRADNPRNTDLDVYTFPRGQQLKIIIGDIVCQQVEAIVSSDTSWLGMEFGVSVAIRRAAGESVVHEARRKAPVRPGRAIVTSAGKLPSRLVIHAVTVGAINELFISPSRNLISEIMSSCIYHADSHEIASIAFPLLGTGAMQFPRDTCLDTMFHFLVRLFLHGLSSVREARIVIYDTM